ncbi:MAG: hypothetical protein CM1200mP15_16690 [Dehalococcoidia bacterium]|nr:MAG: hypothetical protein CM1200mP15_16690 [Dehalococcoidia bacterium]
MRTLAQNAYIDDKTLVQRWHKEYTAALPYLKMQNTA